MNIILRSVFIFLLIINSTFSYGEFVKYGESTIAEDYVDISSISKIDNLISFEEMVNYPYRFLGAYSSKHIWLMDCEKSLFKLIKKIRYQKPMGEGEVLFDIPKAISNWYDKSEWEKYSKGSAMGKMADIVCPLSLLGKSPKQ